MTDYEEYTSSGTFMKWEDVGDCVEGRILDFDLDGGRDFDQQPCPQLTVETDRGVIVISAGQANLKRLLTERSPKLIEGHGVKVTYSGTYTTKQGGTGKEFTLGVTPKPIAPITVELAQDEEPF